MRIQVSLQAYERFGGLSGWRALVAGQLDAQVGLSPERVSVAWATLQPYLQVRSLAISNC